jgi:hypothetical protein
MQVITPPNAPFEPGHPVLFLAAPIQGAVDWQSVAIATIGSLGFEGI